MVSRLIAAGALALVGAGALNAQAPTAIARTMPDGGTATVRGDTLTLVFGRAASTPSAIVRTDVTQFLVQRDTVRMLVEIFDSVFVAPAAPNFARMARAMHAAVANGTSLDDAARGFIVDFRAVVPTAAQSRSGGRYTLQAPGSSFLILADTVLWIRTVSVPTTRTDTLWLRIGRDSSEVIRPGPRRTLPPLLAGALQMLLQSAIDAAEVERLLLNIR